MALYTDEQFEELRSRYIDIGLSGDLPLYALIRVHKSNK